MDDHFWPAIYPGIIVGLLAGLAFGGLSATLLGAAGGLAGAVIAYFALAWLGLGESALSLAGLIGASALGAWLLIKAGERLSRRRGSR